jgi:hypothetical protein
MDPQQINLLLQNPDWLNILATILVAIILLLLAPKAYAIMVRKFNAQSSIAKIMCKLLLGIIWVAIILLVKKHASQVSTPLINL